MQANGCSFNGYFSLVLIHAFICISCCSTLHDTKKNMRYIFHKNMSTAGCSKFWISIIQFLFSLHCYSYFVDMCLCMALRLSLNVAPFCFADTQHQFNVRESDWGFTSFMPLQDLYDPARGFLVNDTLVVEADVNVRKVVDYWAYDSKKETGFVGLKNQGATCYMNSLLQTLYHLPYFRKVLLNFTNLSVVFSVLFCSLLFLDNDSHAAHFILMYGQL